MRLVLILILVLSCNSVYAQNRPDPAIPQGQNLQVPEGWVVRTDHPEEEFIIGAHPDSSDIYFVNMTPGWHISTGPAAIFYHPANNTQGNYQVTASIYFFNPGERQREGYGVFIGGNNLENENQEYIYFLLRNTGEYLIKKRQGEETSVIQDWTPHDAIVIYDNPEVSSVKNDFSVNVSADSIRFMLNGKALVQIPAAGHSTSGHFGLRINHGVNSHIANLAVTEQI